MLEEEEEENVEIKNGKGRKTTPAILPRSPALSSTFFGPGRVHTKRISREFFTIFLNE